MSAPLPMGDAGQLRDVLRDALMFELPRKVDLLRAERSWGEAEMPHAEQVSSGEMSDRLLTTMGATWVLVANPRLRSAQQVDIDPRGLPVFMSRYSARVYVWTKAESHDLVLRARDRLALATKLALLEWPNLRPGTAGDTGYRVYRNTYSEQFGEPQRLVNTAGNRLWAPALLSVEVDVEESMAASTRPPLGQVQTINQNGYSVGPDQPLTPPTN